jgi:multimeric flavodoxin WrbA
MHVLGISGSPKKGGNTFQYLQRAFEATTGDDVETEIVEVAGLKYEDCNHCNWCQRNKTEDRICKQDDDAEPVLQKIKSADVLVVASPAYYGRMTGRLASLLDRTRPLIFSKPHRGCMKDKPGVALSVTWGRNSGAETTLHSILWSFFVLEMLPVSNYVSGSLFGGSAISNPSLVFAQPDDKLSVNSDVVGIMAAQGVVKRAIELHRRLNPIG